MDLVQAHAHGAVGRGLSCLVGRWGVRRSPLLLLIGLSTPTRHYKASASSSPQLRPPQLCSARTDLRRPLASASQGSQLSPSQKRTHSNLFSCPAAAAALGRTPGGSDHHAADLGIRSRCGGGIAMRSRGSCVILAWV
jgi:hypothetical protein